METISFESLVEQLGVDPPKAKPKRVRKAQVKAPAPEAPALEEQEAPEQEAPEQEAPEQEAPEQEAVEPALPPAPEDPEPEAEFAVVKAKRAPRPRKIAIRAPRTRAQVPLEQVPLEQEAHIPEAPEAPHAEPLSNDNILQHLLNHRMRQRVQREELYKSFVSQF
jgi:hypothetical protein